MAAVAGENAAQDRAADSWHGARKWPAWLLVPPFAYVVAAALYVVCALMVDAGAPPALSVDVWVAFIVVLFVAGASSIPAVVWGILWFLWRVLRYGTPPACAVKAELKNAMVNLGYLPPDASRWDVRRFQVVPYRGSGIVLVTIDGMTLKPMRGLADDLKEVHATEALDIEGEELDPMKMGGRRGYRLTLVYGPGSGR